MDAPKGTPLPLSVDRARKSSSDSAFMHAGTERKPGEARPFFSSGVRQRDQGTPCDSIYARQAGVDSQSSGVR
jgi:hypothetical protein